MMSYKILKGTELIWFLASETNDVMSNINLSEAAAFVRFSMTLNDTQFNWSSSKFKYYSVSRQVHSLFQTEFLCFWRETVQEKL
jgi:hypothetical protein